MAVRIRMFQMGRKNRKFFRIVAIDHKQPRDGKALEILGTYDPFVDGEKSVTLVPSRIKYWQSVGAKASEHVEAILRKYMGMWETRESEAAAQKALAAQAAKDMKAAAAVPPVAMAN